MPASFPVHPHTALTWTISWRSLQRPGARWRHKIGLPLLPFLVCMVMMCMIRHNIPPSRMVVWLFMCSNIADFEYKLICVFECFLFQLIFVCWSDLCTFLLKRLYVSWFVFICWKDEKTLNLNLHVYVCKQRIYVAIHGKKSLCWDETCMESALSFHMWCLVMLCTW